MAKKNSEQKVVKSFYLSQDQAQKIRYVEVPLNPLASNSRDSYELCRLVAQPLVIRFCSNISYFFRLALT